VTISPKKKLQSVKKSIVLYSSAHIWFRTGGLQLLDGILQQYKFNSWPG